MKKAAQTKLTAALTAALAVDKSHSTLAKALVSLVNYAVRNDEVQAITEYVKTRRTKSPDSVQTVSVEEWLKTICNLKVDKDGTVSIKANAEYLAEWNQGMKDTPWYKVARQMQQFQVPVINLNGLASMIAKRELLGEEADYDKLLADLKEQVSKAKKAKKVVAWKDEAIKEKDKKGLASLHDLLMVGKAAA